MEVNIEKIEKLEGGRVGVYSIMTQELERLISLHLGKAELSQDGE